MPQTSLDTAPAAVAGPAIAPPEPLFEDVRRIAVLRGGGLGDVLFAVPAIQALRAAYPAAELTLLGTASAELLAARPGGVDRVRRLPAVPGITAPAGPAPADPVASSVGALRAEHLDLAVQLHGGGRHSNPFLLELGARHTVGTRTPDAAPLERNLDYVYYQHEVLRALEVAGLAGAVPVALEPRLALSADERARGREACPPGPFVVLHPGATDPRRRWPLERFAAVARRLLDDGVRVVLVGGGADAQLCHRLARLLADRAAGVTDLAGRLDLPGLAGVLAAADVMLGNDSGPRHLAQAVGTRTASVYWFGNLVNAGPLGRGRHRVQLSWTTRCPVCGRDCTQVGWTAERCAHDDSFVADVDPEAVLSDVESLLDAARGD
ncbi:Glycosyltransferase family 9 protein [Microbacterium sp. 8M]|uniref:glycosyltransferase family 9 protein n=1 Tax=Microbacterium sp. 8M TaxID=2653153 RepID=UPI0012F2F1BB|nr:glycosyltransferase family 9 protein [Microbacterium sp. 8M]VXB81825.1 Glycosyltransferase family 9 protein [Microbacterium sp. 8M]